MRRAIVIAVAIVVAGFAAAAIRADREGRAALAAGDAALASGAPREAIVHWEASARWYVPWAAHVDAARAQLARLAADTAPEHAGTALLAARAGRRAAWAVGDTAPGLDRIIARIEAGDPEGGGGAGDTRDAREAWQLARLSRDVRPHGGASAAAVIGVLMWLAGMAWLVASMRDPSARLARGGTRPGGSRARWQAAAISVGGIALWAAGLWLL